MSKSHTLFRAYQTLPEKQTGNASAGLPAQVIYAGAGFAQPPDCLPEQQPDSGHTPRKLPAKRCNLPLHRIVHPAFAQALQ
jgi:hypothetical protein